VVGNESVEMSKSNREVVVGMLSKASLGDLAQEVQDLQGGPLDEEHLLGSCQKACDLGICHLH
jgi:hypothetical protein